MPDPVKRSPLNLILYGPPGTGKTYRTMAEAVRLCRGLADNDPLLTDPVRRQELRKAYEELRGQGQIGFVTFHQNYAYEDFVEGLRPKPLADGVGFTLVAEPGILRRMADAAEASAEEHVLVQPRQHFEGLRGTYHLDRAGQTARYPSSWNTRPSKLFPSLSLKKVKLRACQRTR